MKKNYLLFSVLLFMTISVKAQSNLQFVKVLTYAGTVNSYDKQEVLIDSVPPGKVWKIEAKGMSGFGVALKINGKKYINVQPFSIGLSSTTGVSINETIWLKSGDVISYAYFNTGTTGAIFTYDYFISILEFNLSQ